jgi:hypothetical protein
MGHAGFAEMDMAIEDPGQNMFALRVDFFLALRQLVVGADGDDFLVADGNASLKGFRGCHYPTVLDY